MGGANYEMARYFMSDLDTFSPIEFFNKTVGSSGKDDKVYGISCLIWVYFHSHIEFLNKTVGSSGRDGKVLAM